MKIKRYKYAYTIGRRMVKAYLEANSIDEAWEKLDTIINISECGSADVYCFQRFHCTNIQLTEVFEKDPVTVTEKSDVITFTVIMTISVLILLAVVIYYISSPAT